MKMAVDNAITTIVEGMLPRFSPRDKGLILELDISYFYHSSDEDDVRSYNRIVWMFFHRSGNYTKFFI